MGTTGIKKSAVDIFFAIMKVPCLPALVPGDSAHADALLVAKRKLMSFGKHALRERSPECEEPFNLLPVYDPSDWRVRQKPRSMHSDTANVAFKVLWQRSFFTPVPSRFRGVWENRTVFSCCCSLRGMMSLSRCDGFLAVCSHCCRSFGQSPEDLTILPAGE